MHDVRFFRHEIEGTSILIPVPFMTPDQQAANMNAYGNPHGIDRLICMRGDVIIIHDTIETITIAVEEIKSLGGTHNDESSNSDYTKSDK